VSALLQVFIQQRLHHITAIRHIVASTIHCIIKPLTRVSIAYLTTETITRKKLVNGTVAIALRQKWRFILATQ
jgi:hypothetical protein